MCSIIKPEDLRASPCSVGQGGFPDLMPIRIELVVKTGRVAAQNDHASESFQRVREIAMILIVHLVSIVVRSSAAVSA